MHARKKERLLSAPKHFPDCSITTFHIRTMERSMRSVSQAQERKLVIWGQGNHRKKKDQAQIANSRVWISVGDNIGSSGCAAVPKLKSSITVLLDKVVLSQFHHLWPPPTHTHTLTESWTLLLAKRQRGTCGKSICLLCAILLKQLKQLIAVWQGHSGFRPLCIWTSKCDPYQRHRRKFHWPRTDCRTQIPGEWTHQCGYVHSAIKKAVSGSEISVPISANYNLYIWKASQR